MAKLVDALVSGASPVKRVEVRVFFWAPFLLKIKTMKKNKTNNPNNRFQKQPSDIETENARKIILFITKRSNPDRWHSKKLCYLYKEREQKIHN